MMHCRKEGRGLVMGPTGSGEFNALLGRVEPLYQG